MCTARSTRHARGTHAAHTLHARCSHANYTHAVRTHAARTLRAHGESVRTDLPPQTREDMASFVTRELLQPQQGWMRAQSLLDPAAARSDRTDHGPWGAYSGWPAITAAALAALGHQRSGLGVLRRAAALTQRGPWGQAHALHRDGDVHGDVHGKGGREGGKGGKGGAAYKPFEFTLYNEAVGAAFVDATLHVVFGLRAAAAPLMDALPWPPVAPDARTPLGAGGVAAELHLLRWQGALFNATAAADGGVTWRAS